MSETDPSTTMDPSTISRGLERGSNAEGETIVQTVSHAYATSVDDLWDAVTNPERLPRWFAPVHGDLELGGRYQVEGNAGGIIETCEPPHRFSATWEFGGGTSWIAVQVLADGPGARLTLEHTAQVTDDTTFWDQYGPGATGVGWDLSFMGLGKHLASGEAVTAEHVEGWETTPEGLAFITGSSRLWAARPASPTALPRRLPRPPATARQGSTPASPGESEVQDLVVTYGRVEAVRTVSFEAAPGSLVTLVGANGAGKSSIINAVSGIIRPRSGKIIFEGRDITRTPAHRLVGEGLVQVPEGRQVLGTLTIHENLQLGAWHSKDNAAIQQVYDRFPVLAERRDLPAGALSGGEQQMLAIGRALVAGPRLILLDEPSMGLAPKIVDEIFTVIEEIRASGTTVVLVEQNARRALRAADHGYVLASGEIAHEGPAAELLADERVVQAYLGV